jgi:hypothetical protein
MANQFSLTRRLRSALERDGVPITPAELDTLKRVRDVRSRALHGSEALEISSEEIDLACSLLSRALVHRMARQAAERVQL